MRTLIVSLLTLVLAAGLAAAQPAEEAEQAKPTASPEQAKGPAKAGLTADQIKAALAADRTATACYPLYGGSWLTKQAFGCLTTPYSRVVAAAQNARKMYQEPTLPAPDVIADGEVHIHAFSHAIKRDVSSPVMVVLMPAKSKDKSKAIRPTRIEESKTHYSNAYGATSEGKELMAVFPMELLSDRYEIPPGVRYLSVVRGELRGEGNRLHGEGRPEGREVTEPRPGRPVWCGDPRYHY